MLAVVSPVDVDAQQAADEGGLERFAGVLSLSGSYMRTTGTQFQMSSVAAMQN